MKKRGQFTPNYTHIIMLYTGSVGVEVHVLLVVQALYVVVGMKHLERNARGPLLARCIGCDVI